MICQFCETEYPEGTERCARCGTELLEELPPETSELILEPLAEVARRRELELLVARLEQARIPYVVQSGTALGMQDMQAFRDTVRRKEWEARVLVVSSRHEEAAAELAAAAEDLANEPEPEWDEDWDEEQDEEPSEEPGVELDAEADPESLPDDAPERDPAPRSAEPLTLKSLDKIFRK
jgi:hypothetical protein